MSLRHALVLVLALALAPLASARAQPADFTADGLAQRMEELRPALEAVLGAPLGPSVPVVPSTRAELRQVIATEYEAVLAGLEGGSRGAELAEQCAAEAESISALCFGKLDLASGAIRIVPETFARFATIAPEWSGVRGQPFLDVVLLHEAVHVAQDRSSSLRAFVGQPRSIEELRARFAVIEGHAQWVARRAASRLGLEGAFALFLSTIATVPAAATSDPGLRLMLEAHTSNAAFQYIDGERFFGALVDALGSPKAALGHALEAPPRSFRAVSHPDEYLAPPAPPSDDVAAIARAAVELLPAGWRTTVVPLPEPTLRTVFAPGGDALVTRALAAYRDGAVAVGGSPTGAQRTIAVMLAASPEGAAELVACEEALGRAKDELFKGDGGAFQVTSAGYETLTVPVGELRLEGMLMTKVLAVRGQAPIHSTTLVVACGALVVEVSAVDLEATEPGLLGGAARGVFERAATARGR